MTRDICGNSLRWEVAVDRMIFRRMNYSPKIFSSKNLSSAVFWSKNISSKGLSSKLTKIVAFTTYSFIVYINVILLLYLPFIGLKNKSIVALQVGPSKYSCIVSILTVQLYLEDPLRDGRCQWQHRKN